MAQSRTWGRLLLVSSGAPVLMRPSYGFVIDRLEARALGLPVHPLNLAEETLFLSAVTSVLMNGDSLYGFNPIMALIQCQHESLSQNQRQRRPREVRLPQDRPKCSPPQDSDLVGFYGARLSV